MKVSELCRMIEDSIRSGRYPLDTETQKKLAGSLQVTSVGEDDLQAANVAVETRVRDLYVVSNYVPGISHLPGMIEADAVDAFKMICRKVDRIDSGVQINKKR